jgi:hypothetical protein
VTTIAASKLTVDLVAGVVFVLYTGQQTLPKGEKPGAVPLEALWRLAS